MAGIPKRFVGQLDDGNIAAGAGIQSSKLADGANFLKRDASVVMTAALDAGNNKIVNVTTPTNGGDAANKTYVDLQINNIPSLYNSKGAARAMATGNVTVSNPGTAVFDTVTLVAGDKLFLGNQAAPAENGLWIFNGSAAALTRDPEMDTWAEVLGGLFSIEEGSANISKLLLMTVPKTGTLGTTAITYIQVNSAGLASANFVNNETVAGTINGSNTAFTLANTPVASSEDIYCNGYRLVRGTDYTITGNAITMTVAPLAGEVLTADYRK